MIFANTFPILFNQSDEACPHDNVHWNPNHGMFECNVCHELRDILEIADDDPQIDIEIDIDAPLSNPGCKKITRERKPMLTEEDIVNRAVNVSPEPIRQAFIDAEEEEVARRERNKSFVILAGLIIAAILIGFVLYVVN